MPASKSLRSAARYGVGAVVDALVDVGMKTVDVDDESGVVKLGAVDEGTDLRGLELPEQPATRATERIAAAARRNSGAPQRPKPPSRSTAPSDGATDATARRLTNLYPIANKPWGKGTDWTKRTSMIVTCSTTYVCPLKTQIGTNLFTSHSASYSENRAT